jgi:molybdate transport system substrate-binding protein
MVYLPCVIAEPMAEVVATYAAAHPEVDVATDTDKPLSLVGRAERGHEGPAAIVTMGDVEMRWLVNEGAVEAADVRTIAINSYPLVVVAAAEGAPGAEGLADLAGPTVKRIYVEDPGQSTLGDRTVQGLKQLGLWDDVVPKVVRPDPNAMVLSELIAGKADAAVVFRDCLFGEGDSERSIPKTIRVIGEIPDGTYPRIPYQAAALRGTAHPEAARQFVEFLASPEGRYALESAGLKSSE